MKAPSHDVISRLRERYLLRSRERLAEIERALTALEVDPRDASAIGALVRTFHGIAGSGGTYGSERITLIGQEGEALSRRIQSGDERVDPEQYRRLRELVELIRNELLHPLPQEYGTPLVPITPIDRDSKGEVRRILLVGPRSSATPIVEAFRDNGMRVSTSGSVEEAIDSISRTPPDVVISDVELPDRSGYELVQTVRERPDGERTVAFIISSRESFLDKVEAIRCGADGSFQEPVDESAVVRRVNMILHRAATDPPVVLAVEDDPEQAESISGILEAAGYRTVVCSDPGEFESALARNDPDLLLIDTRLPGVSGYELARVVRQDEAHAALPILFLTTESRTEAAIESIRSGADDVLLKPISPTLLLTSVAARIERARMLRHLLDRDGLTGLLTHTAFIERLNVALKERTRFPGRSNVLVMLDIDHFKRVNDEHGHPVGDKILASLAGYLRRRLRQSDTIGRYGGEEFGILLHDLDTDEAKRLFERMIEEFAEIDHPVAGDGVVNIRFSVGIALLDPPSMPEVSDWIGAADEALYRAKDLGRARVEVAD